MNTSVFEREGVACAIAFSRDCLEISLSDGRKISVPLTWYPRLLRGTREEREHYEFIGHGEGVHWPELDEDISIEGILSGRPSQENHQSLRKWIEVRERSRPVRVVAERRDPYGKRKR